MNANELADALQGSMPWINDDVIKQDASTMLRQQQAEIEVLKEKVMKNTYSEEKVDLCKEKLKPVAELVLEQMAVGDASSLRIKWLMDGYPPVGTKLYTQSNAQLHPLTDYEICQCVEDCRLGEVCKKRCSKKPAIWIEKKALEYKFASGINTTTVEQENKTDLVPLYTHPVKELDVNYETVFDGEKYTTKLVEPKVKDLTDEEKWEVFRNLARSPDLRADMIRFADSILRKAQEK